MPQEPVIDFDQDAQHFEVADPSAHIDQSTHVDIGEPDKAPKKSSSKKKLLGFIFILLAGALGAASFVFGGGSSIVSVDANVVKSENTGSIVYLSGELAAKDITDPMFQVTANGAGLKRTVEMFQWVQNADKFEKNWSEQLVAIPEEEAKKQNIQNPTEILIKSEKFGVDEVKIGAFILDESLANQALVFSDVALSKDTFAKLDSDGQQAFTLYKDKYYFFGIDPENPEVGDLRISFSKADGGTFSVLAKEQGSQLVPAITGDGPPIAKIMAGNHPLEQMSAGVSTGGGSLMTWAMRGGAGFLLLMGFVMMLGKSGPKAPKQPKPEKEKKKGKLLKEDTEELLASLSKFSKENEANEEMPVAEMAAAPVGHEQPVGAEDFYIEPEPPVKPSIQSKHENNKHVPEPLQFSSESEETNEAPQLENELSEELAGLQLPELPEFNADPAPALESTPSYQSPETMPMPDFDSDSEIPSGVEIIGDDSSSNQPSVASEIPLPPFSFDNQMPEPAKTESAEPDDFEIPPGVEIIGDGARSLAEDKPISVKELLSGSRGLDFEVPVPAKSIAEPEIKTAHNIPTFIDNSADDEEKGLEFIMDDMPADPIEPIDQAPQPKIEEDSLPPLPEDDFAIEDIEIEDLDEDEDEDEDFDEEDEDHEHEESELHDDIFSEEDEDDEEEDDEEEEDEDDDDDFELDDDENYDEHVDIEESEDDDVPLPPPPPILTRKTKPQEAPSMPAPQPAAPRPKSVVPPMPVQEMAPPTGGLSFELPNIPDDFDPSREMESLPEENSSDEGLEDFSHTDDDNFSPFDINSGHK